MIFPFVCQNSMKAGMCDVERYGNLIILTELKDNPAMSVTNAVEYIATQYVNQNDIALSDVVVVERYDERSYDGGYRGLPRKDRHPTMSLVKFTIGQKNGREHLVSPEWEHLPEDAFRVLRWAHSLHPNLDASAGPFKV